MSVPITMDFTGRVAVVTGGTRGIGAAIVDALADAGAHVLATGRDEATIEALAGQGLPRREYVAVDLAASCDDALLGFADRIAAMDRIDILVNNAGVNRIGDIVDYDLDDFDDVVRLDLRAPWLLTKAAGARMAEAGYGRIVNIASMYGVITRAGRSAYTSAKAGLIGQTKTAAVEFARSGVLVNAVSPGFVVTDMTRTVLGEAEMDRLAATVPIGRMAEPAEIASVVAFLASDRNTFMTGQNIVVDGGYVDI